MAEEIKNEIVDETENLIYVGLIMRKDGWYEFYSDGNKNYTFKKVEK